MIAGTEVNNLFSGGAGADAFSGGPGNDLAVDFSAAGGDTGDDSFL